MNTPPPATPAPASRASNEALIYGYLTGHEGFTPAGAAAALGNFQVESGFDPNAWNPGEQARGLAQWEGGRRTGSSGLIAYAAAHGGKETDLAMQLGYLSQELRGGYSRVAAYMRSATNPADAAAVWDQQFEGSSGSTRSERVSNAQTIYQQVQQGKALTGGPSSATSSVPAGSGGAGWSLGDLGTIFGGPLGNLAGATGIGAGVMQSVSGLVIKSAFAAAGLALVVMGAGLSAKKEAGI